MGDFPANSPVKPGYTLEWSDEFAGPELDPTKWLPLYLPHWSSRQQSAPNYVLRDGTLVLQITADQQPWCPEFDGAVKASCIQTGLFAGPVGSKEGQLRFNPELVVREAQTNVALYTPRYGYFECRARATAAQGNHVALYMIGYGDAPDRCGEINMFEIFGKDVGAASARVGYGVRPWEDPALTDGFAQAAVAIDATAFHIYAHEWTPTHVAYYVDNQLIGWNDQSPAYPMQLILSIYELPGGDPGAPYPKEFVVDYVRVFQPEGGYQ